MVAFLARGLADYNCPGVEGGQEDQLAGALYFTTWVPPPTGYRQPRLARTFQPRQLGRAAAWCQAAEMPCQCSGIWCDQYLVTGCRCWWCGPAARLDPPIPGCASWAPYTPGPPRFHNLDTPCLERLAAMWRTCRRWGGHTTWSHESARWEVLSSASCSLVRPVSTILVSLVPPWCTWWKSPPGWLWRSQLVLPRIQHTPPPPPSLVGR